MHRTVKFSFPLLVSALVSVLLTSCGGVRYYQHAGNVAPQGEVLEPVILRVGETKKVVKHTMGLMSIGGGYIQGVYVQDPSVVSVRYGEDGQGDKFEPLQTISGLKPGVTRAIYGNRLSEAPDSNSSVGGFQSPRSFTVEVKP